VGDRKPDMRAGPDCCEAREEVVDESAATARAHTCRRGPVDAVARLRDHDPVGLAFSDVATVRPGEVDRPRAVNCHGRERRRADSRHVVCEQPSDRKSRQEGGTAVERTDRGHLIEPAAGRFEELEGNHDRSVRSDHGLNAVGDVLQRRRKEPTDLFRPVAAAVRVATASCEVANPVFAPPPSTNRPTWNAVTILFPCAKLLGSTSVSCCAPPPRYGSPERRRLTTSQRFSESPRSPVTMSRPGPQRTTSLVPSAAAIRSLPAPPDRTSAPTPPLIRSSPARPWISSLPP